MLTRVRWVFLPDAVSPQQRRTKGDCWFQAGRGGTTEEQTGSPLYILPPSVAPAHTHIHTVLHSCLCRAFTLTCCHFQTLTASFPNLIFTLTFNAEVKGSKIFPRPQHVNSFPKLPPLSGVCCASRELNTEQETFIQTQIEVSHPSPSRLLSTFYLIVSVSHIPPPCSSSESQN